MLPCVRQESKHSLRQTQLTLLYTLCLLILSCILVEGGKEIRRETSHVKPDLVCIWLGTKARNFYSFQKILSIDSVHSGRCEVRIWVKNGSSCSF